MGTRAIFTFNCHISGITCIGHICSPDGQTVIIDAHELPELLLDLAANGEGIDARAKHHNRVLEEWFSRKAHRVRPTLRVVG